MKHRIAASLIPEGGTHVVELDGHEIALIHHQGRIRAVGHRCPHARGPLALGKVEDGEVICPWHGARFDLECGRPTWGPTAESIPVYQVMRIGDEIEITLAVSGD